MDIDEVLDYMIDNGHIDEETGDAKSDEYSDYLSKCVTPEYGIFSTGGEEDQSGGTEDWEKCTIDGENDIYNYFRVYTLDKSIVDSMEDDPTQSEANSDSAPSIPDGDWMWPINPGESKAGPCFGGPRGHAGLDINSNQNSDVYAMQTGQVVQTGSGGAAGNYIIIKGESGVWYAYQHLVSKPTITGTVEKGQIIGKAGKTGNVRLGSSSAHLHVTMSNKRATMGSYGNISEVFDPMTVLSGVKPDNYTCTRT